MVCLIHSVLLNTIEEVFLYKLTLLKTTFSVQRELLYLSTLIIIFHLNPFDIDKVKMICFLRMLLQMLVVSTKGNPAIQTQVNPISIFVACETIKAALLSYLLIKIKRVYLILNLQRHYK